jgi:hypothetical protein
LQEDEIVVPLLAAVAALIRLDFSEDLFFLNLPFVPKPCFPGL